MLIFVQQGTETSDHPPPLLMRYPCYILLFLFQGPFRDENQRQTRRGFTLSTVSKRSATHFQIVLSIDLPSTISCCPMTQSLEHPFEGGPLQLTCERCDTTLAPICLKPGAAITLGASFPKISSRCHPSILSQYLLLRGQWTGT